MNEINYKKPLILIKNGMTYQYNATYNIIQFTACTPLTNFKSIVIKILDPKIIKKFIKSPIKYDEVFKVTKGLDNILGDNCELREVIIADYENVKVGENK